MTRVCFAALCAIWFAAAAPGQNPDPEAGRPRGESAQTRTRLTECQQKLDDGKTAEAADDLLKLLDEAGDDLISFDGKTYLPARRYANGLLARLPADARNGLRDRLDAPASKLFEQGRTRRDSRPLRLLLDRYFVARPAEDALLLLGELAFTHGEFRAAEAYWRRLLPGGPPESSSYPDSKADPAMVRARIGLARLFGGDAVGAAAEVVALKDQFPKAAGRLAGRDGPYAAALEALLKNPPRVPPEATPDGDWTAFAGSPARAGAAAALVPRHWSPRPDWRTPIPAANEPGTERARPYYSSARSCAFHPVVLEDKAYIADAARVIGFDLHTGRASVGYDLREHPAWPNLTPQDLSLPPPAGADFTLTAANDRLYVRLGRQSVAPAQDTDGKPQPTSVLICLAPDAKESGKLVAKWELAPPPAADGTPVAWEAAPMASGGHLYAAVTRFEGNRAVHAVVAYDDPPGRPLWVTDVCDAPAAPADAPRTRPEPLTLAGGVLVFCSHAGVIAAVDAATGKPAWAFRYPRANRLSGSPSPRDLCPAVHADGRVFAAPADADAVFALDAATGKPLWELPGVQVEQLLGISLGRLVVTLHGPAKGIRGLNVRTGAYADPDGWQTHDDPQLGSFGRGLVGEEFVLWPTASKEGTYLLNAADGTNAAGWQTLREARGNLAFADGVLIVATPTEVMGYIPHQYQPDQPEAQARAALIPRPRVRATTRPPFPVSRLAESPTPPDLGIPIAVKRVALPNPRCVPLLPFPGESDLLGLGGDVPESVRCLVVADDRTAFGYRPGADRPSWSAALPDGFRATHAASIGDRLVLAGPRGAAVLRLTDGSVGLVARIPDDAPDLSEFVLAGSKLVARLGDHHLIGLDPAAGEIAWVRDGNGRPRFTLHPFPNAPTFTPHLGSDGRTVVAQLSTGRRWSVNGDTGEVTADEPTALAPWEAAPALAPDGALIVSDGPGEVRRLTELVTGRFDWTHDVGGEASLTGRPPVARWLNGSAVVAVARNYGVEVDRLNRSGESVWFQTDRAGPPVVLPSDGIDLRLADADGQWAYLPAGGKLTAVRWASGRPAWAADLSATAGPAGAGIPWAARATRNAVLAFPTAAVPFDPPDDVFARAARRFLGRPAVDRLPGLTASVYDAWTARTIPVLAFDPASGSLLHRLDLPAAGPTVAFHAGPTVVATAGVVYWLK